MFAIIETGGKQYKVSEGDIIYIEKLDVEPASEITLDRVLAVEENGSLKFGKPTVDGATVTASVVKNGKAKKILVFKYKAKKNYRRRKGHRQPYTKLQINKISV